MGKKVECGRGATREKYRYYGQIFLKTVIIVSNVPHTVTKKILKTQQKKSTGFYGDFGLLHAYLKKPGYLSRYPLTA